MYQIFFLWCYVIIHHSKYTTWNIFPSPWLGRPGKRSKGQFGICSYSSRVVFYTHPHSEQLVFIERMQQITEFKCQVQILILISKSNSFFWYKFLVSTCYCIGILKEDLVITKVEHRAMQQNSNCSSANICNWPETASWKQVAHTPFVV